MSEYDDKTRLKTLFNGFLMGLGFGLILTGGQGFFIIGGIMVLIGGTLERREQRK
jgi:hypothetical protein